jgi:hypothetical protein
MARKRIPIGRLKSRVKAPRGRPRVHTEAWAKVSVVLFERQVLHLDRLATDIRRANGRAMNRAEIIRALIDGVINSGLDMSEHGTEAGLRAYIAKCLNASAD